MTLARIALGEAIRVATARSLDTSAEPDTGGKADGQVGGRARMKSLLLVLSGICHFLQLPLHEAFTVSPRGLLKGALSSPMQLALQPTGRKPVSGCFSRGSWRAAPGVGTAVAGGAGAVAARGGRLGGLFAEVGRGVQQEEEQKEEGRAVEEPAQGSFEWKRQWYPVAVLRDLEAMDPRKPYPVKLMGEALVVWREPGNDRGWKCFADRCPHRWAPLSEGRVDQTTGRLQCIYHGWEFEGDGKCGSIPQADPAARDSAQNSKRACATVIPTKVAQGKLWLWPDSSPEGVEASERVPPVVLPELDSDDFGGHWYARDLPYGFDTLIENLADPAHVPFAHHGVMGARPMGTHMDITMEKEQGENGFRTSKTGFAGRRNMVVGFEAPGLIYYRTDYSDALPGLLARLPPPLKALAWVVNTLKLDKRMAMKPEERKDNSDLLLSLFTGYAVPTTPGHCRIFTRQSRNFFLQHPVIPRRWRNSMSKEHSVQTLALDGDTPTLHLQERDMLSAGHQGGAKAERTFFMPTDADAPVRAFRTWYNGRGGGGPTWAEGVDPTDLGPVLTREQMLDRMESHTKDCSACGKAFRVSGRVKRASAAAALVLLAAASVAPRGPKALWLAGSAMASSGLSVAMGKRQQTFVFEDYVHATRDG